MRIFNPNKQICSTAICIAGLQIQRIQELGLQIPVTDEPSMFDYSGNAYQPNMYRSSDHDPVVVGLSLGIVNDVKNINSEDKIKISPTVANDHFVVSNAYGDVIQLYTTSGVLLKQEKVTSNEYIVNLSNLRLTSGVYFVRTLGEGSVKRIIVMKQ